MKTDLKRNNKCGCGSGKKYKKCCINRNWNNYKQEKSKWKKK